MKYIAPEYKAEVFASSDVITLSAIAEVVHHGNGIVETKIDVYEGTVDNVEKVGQKSAFEFSIGNFFN